MSVKKLLVLSAAGLAVVAMATAAIAGGPDIAPVPVPSYTGIYLQGDIGYAAVDWRSIYGPFVNFGSNGRGGFTFGGSVGYQFTRYLAAELGAYYLPRIGWNVPGFVNNGHIDSWFGYLAGKLMAPIPWVDNLDAFFKAGVAYRRVNISGGGSSKLDLWRPMFGAGLQYWFYQNWYLKGQWLHVAEGNRATFSGSTFSFDTPAVNLFTIGLGYKFAL